MEQKLLTISALIESGWNLYINNLQKLLAPMLIAVIPLIPFYLAIFSGYQSNSLLVMLLNALTIIINLWVAIMLIMVIDKLIKNQASDLKQIANISFRKIASYFWVMILAVLASLAGFILFIIPGIIFTVWFSFASLINVLENKNNKGIAALQESKNMVKGRWWQIFARLLLPALFVYFILILVIVGIIYIITGGQLNTLESSNQAMMTINIITSLISLLITPLLVSFSVILYDNLKELKIQPEQKIQIQA